MKIKFFLFIFLLVSWKMTLAQSTLITPGNNQQSITTTSINGGVLVPRIILTSNLASASPLTSPPEGTLVYNNGANQTKGFYFWTGSAWSLLAVSTPSLSAASPIIIQSNTIRLNAGTATGQLITWDGTNWVNTSPKSQTAISNIQPYLTVNYCIALQGVFPSRNGLDPFLGEIEIFGFNFAPIGWAACNGQLLSIAQNTALFSLLGTTYGGNGTTTFGLPNLQGRVPIHQGTGAGLSSYVWGQQGGVETNFINDKY
jgi:microcystin-dependent protein